MLRNTTRIISPRRLQRPGFQYRFLTTEAPEQQQEQQKPERYGAFRSAPSSLGVRDPPVVDHNNWIQRNKQKLRDFVDYEKAFAAHAAERRHLVEEATKSYFADVHEMRQHGGKMYFANTQLVKPEKAGYMPNFEAQNLSSQKINTTEKLVGKITLMTFVYAKFGEPHVETFIKPFMQKYKDNKDVQVVEVNVQENLLKQLLLKAFVPSIRKNLPQERKDNYCLILKDISRTRKYLDMTNQYIGYAFLVDQDCKVRWTAHGEATPEEVSNMLAMTDYLYDKKLKITK
ncbi:ATPase assembly factor ATP10 [Gilbertella persicaria]|uniref:Mitochondrial ATPase complex subunit atp10 n=1 Tax=Rhizopus stolonifer TaxID=4846 RepID=A0A367KKD8_RHIST|nr:ATPase assembly factor ATP10 [Gilbertella persicaria]KAI8054962.1 ATPase assembly factor ATP10 [Gilbertella persicaria]RCI02601.1 Mitochondrial ATPase complex subunit atp10 [Rhizopus stolonifer]